MSQPLPTVADIAVPYSLKVNEGIQGCINFVTFNFNQQKKKKATHRRTHGCSTVVWGLNQSLIML